MAIVMKQTGSSSTVSTWQSENGYIHEVVLQRVAKLNAMNGAFFDDLSAAFDRIEQSPDARCVIVRAEGRMFTAGLDLQEASQSFLLPTATDFKARLELLDHIRQLQRCFSRIHSFRIPVIAAIHGSCIGGGVDLALSCDVRLCTSDAVFSVRETQIAIVADLGTLQHLARVVGRGFAHELALTGGDVDAKRAQSIGLVNEVYATKEQLMEGARAMASVIAGNSPITVQATKKVLLHAEAHSLQDGMEFVQLWNTAFLQNPDLHTAFSAFATRTKPEFDSLHSKL